MGSPGLELVDVELVGSYCQMMGNNLKFNKALTANTQRACIEFQIASLHYGKILWYISYLSKPSPEIP